LILRSLLAAALLFSGCAAKNGHVNGPHYAGSPYKVTWSSAKKQAVYCYTTKQAVQIYKFDIVCPNKKLIEGEISNFIARVGANDEALKHAKIIFTSRWLICSGRGRLPGDRIYGCAWKGVAMVRLGGSYWSWADTLSHELGHLLISRVKMQASLLHLDKRLLRAMTSLMHKDYMLQGTLWDGVFADVKPPTIDTEL